MGLADLVPPVTSWHWNDGELSQNDGPVDGSGYLPGALTTQTDMSIVTPDGDVSYWAYWLVGVCFCTGIIFRTSSLREASRKKNQWSQIPWWAGRRDLSPPGTWSSCPWQHRLVTEIHSLSLALPLGAQAPQPWLQPDSRPGCHCCLASSFRAPGAPGTSGTCSSTGTIYPLVFSQRRPHRFTFLNICKVPSATFVQLIFSSKWCNTHILEHFL